MGTLEYETIHRVLTNYKTENFDKINVYGVITFINSPRLTISNNYCTSITLVDESCLFDEKLKTIVFSSSDDLHTVHRSCEVGDIIRFHRFKIQDYKSQAQGCSNAAFTSWIRFKKDADDYTFEGNRNSTITPQDEDMVKGLRDWLKTKPALAGLIEAKLSEPVAMDTGDQATANAVDASVQSPSKRSRLNEETSLSRDSNLFNKLLYLQPKLTTLTNVKQDGFFDLVCQLCAKCSSKGFKFIIVWDGTATNLAVHQESEFVLDNSEADDSARVFYKRSITDKSYQMFLFDEYAELISQLEPGDFLLLKNAQSKKPTNSVADTVLKMPSGGKSYKRDMVKLASADGRVNIPRDIPEALNTVAARVQEIKAAGEALNISFIDEADFFSIFRSLSFNDSVLADNTNKRTSPARAAPRPQNGKEPLSVEALLRDQVSQYRSDDDENEEQTVSPSKQQQTTRTLNTQVGSPSIRSTSPKKTHSSVTITAQSPVVTNRPVLVLNRSEKLALMSASQEERNDEFYRSLGPRFHLKPFRIPLRRIDFQQVKTEAESASSQEFISAESHEGTEAHNTQQELLPRPPPPPAQIAISLTHSEMSSDINQLPKLVNMTYVVPFFTEANFALSRPTLPSAQHQAGQQFFFENLNFLSQAAQQASFVKCKVVAKLFNFSISSCPQIATVFVNCKKCGYINFTPFHLATIHQAPLLTSVINDLKRGEEESPMETDEEIGQDEEVDFVLTETVQVDERPSEKQTNVRIPAHKVIKFREDLKLAQNFNLRWLKTVMPFDMQIRATQSTTQTQSTGESDSIPIMFYECPRCAFRAKYLDKQQQANTQNDDESYMPVTLEYIYRFWFVLRDTYGQLNTCLLEGDAAHKFLNIPASKFYTNTKIVEPGAKAKSAGKNASHQVYQHINKCFNKKYLFSIESFNLDSIASRAAVNNGATPSRLSKKTEIHVVYKITDMVEIV